MTIHTANRGLRMTATLSFSIALLTAAPGLTITSPGDGSPATPGQSLAVTVTPNGSFTQVVLVGEGPIGYSGILTAPPYQFLVPIPARISPGHYALTALGVSATGNASSTPITISVERTDAPVQIDVTPNTLNLSVGQRTPLRVIGTYADGTSLDITRSVSTTFLSKSPGVAAVDSQGAVTAVGPGTTRIVVNNTLSVPVAVPTLLSIAPQWPVLYSSQREQFSTFEPGMAAIQVKWSINPQLGSINDSGVYTAPNKIPSGNFVTITATLRDNPAMSISTGVVLFPPITITIDPSPTVTMSAGQTLRFTPSISNALDNNVDWSVAPKGIGSIDNTGLYTAPATLKTPLKVVVTATSIADKSKSASSTITLQP